MLHGHTTSTTNQLVLILIWSKILLGCKTKTNNYINKLYWVSSIGRVCVCLLHNWAHSCACGFTLQPLLLCTDRPPGGRLRGTAFWYRASYVMWYCMDYYTPGMCAVCRQCDECLAAGSRAVLVLCMWSTDYVLIFLWHSLKLESPMVLNFCHFLKWLLLLVCDQTWCPKR